MWGMCKAVQQEGELEAARFIQAQQERSECQGLSGSPAGFMWKGTGRFQVWAGQLHVSRYPTWATKDREGVVTSYLEIIDGFEKCFWAYASPFPIENCFQASLPARQAGISWTCMIQRWDLTWVMLPDGVVPVLFACPVSFLPTYHSFNVWALPFDAAAIEILNTSVVAPD